MKSRLLFTDLSSNPASFSQLLTSLCVHDLMEDWGEAPTTSTTVSAATEQKLRNTIDKSGLATISLGSRGLAVVRALASH